ncbi:MAG: hypothetical protein AC479_04775 [miscellaneous Crenarchaeota group-6 archaeon AD8-1]|nr:MAG: hypothetical protein AC479_04775 [miscellaneous Crenarchaeota group-6 archaeon AD8-1]
MDCFETNTNATIMNIAPIPFIKVIISLRKTIEMLVATNISVRRSIVDVVAEISFSPLTHK